MSFVIPIGKNLRIIGERGCWILTGSVPRDRFHGPFSSLIEAYESRAAGYMTLREMPSILKQDRLILGNFAADDRDATLAVVQSRIRLALEHLSSSARKELPFDEGYCRECVQALDELWKGFSPQREPLIAETIRGGVASFNLLLDTNKVLL